MVLCAIVTVPPGRDARRRPPFEVTALCRRVNVPPFEIPPPEQRVVGHRRAHEGQRAGVQDPPPTSETSPAA